MIDVSSFDMMVPPTLHTLMIKGITTMHAKQARRSVAHLILEAQPAKIPMLSIYFYLYSGCCHN
jgi:hypothetical protein